MTGKRRWVWWLSATLALLAAGAGVAIWRAQESATRLTIDITGLPGSAQPTITVAGADGFRRSVTAPTTLQVPPGSVRVIPAPVKAAHATYYTPEDVLTAAVDRGESDHVAVDYRIAVANNARILDITDTGLAKTTTGKDRELLFRADAKSAQNLKVGDIVLSAEGPRTPHGLLGRVVGRERRGSLLAVETTPARLSEAMPKAVLRFPRTPPRAATPSANMDLASYTAPDPSPTPDLHEDGEMAIRMDTWQGKGKLKGVKCGTGIPLVKLETTWPKIDLAGTDLGFNLREAIWAQVQARITYSAKATFGTPHGAQCSWDIEPSDTTLRLPPLTAQLLRVGPFRMQPEIEFIAGIEVKASTGMKIESEAREDFTVKSRLSLLPYATARIDGWPGKYETKLSGATEGKLKGKAGLRLRLKASDPLEIFTAGFFVDAVGAIEGSIDPTKPEAKVEVFGEGGIGMEVEPPGEFKAREIGATFPTRKYTLWKSSKVDPLKDPPCPTPASLKAAVAATLQAPSEVHLGVSKCWPGWSAVVWADAPATDVVTMSVFTRSTGQLRLATDLVPVMDDPDDPVWLHDCSELRAMNPPAELIDFVGCPTSTQAPSTAIDGAAALRRIHEQNFTTTVTADELADMPGPLRAVTASCVGSANGNCVSVFFFYGNRYVGQAAGSSLLDIAAQNGTEVTLSRPIFKDTDPTCCPSGGNETHRVHWNGTAVVSSPSLPHYEPASEPL